nr:hypothetical protein Iba_chr12dCG12480 [Ipomoea batatas]
MIIVCPGNLRRDGGGGQSSVMREGRHCGHLRHRSLALELALESSRRAFALTILSPNSNSHPNKRQIREERGVHARWCSKVCLLALPVRAGNMGFVLHSLCWIMAKALRFSTIDKSRFKYKGRTRN